MCVVCVKVGRWRGVHRSAGGSVCGAPGVTPVQAIGSNERMVRRRQGVAPRRLTRAGYLAYSTARVSRTTVTRIWPGYCRLSSIFLAMSRLS